MRVIVTGANGFVGFHTVRAILDANYDVTALDVSDSRLRTEFQGNPHCTIAKADILGDDLERFIKPGDKVIHLAAVPRFEQASQNPQKAVRINVEGTINVIQACINKKAERLVYSSTGSVYGRNATVPIREDAMK